MPKGAGTFSTALNFMKEHSDYAMFYYYYKITDPTWVDYHKVHKMDRPHKGQKPTQVHKVDGPQKRDQDSSP